MNQNTVMVRQWAWLVLVGLILGLLDWLGYLGSIKIIGNVILNPVEIRVERLKSSYRSSWDRLAGSDNVSSELQEMRQLVQGEIQLESEINKLRNENFTLKKLIAVHEGNIEVQMASVLLRMDDGVYINVGARHGIEKGMAVMVDGVLWGQIVDVEKLKSKVKLLNSDGTEWRVAVLNKLGGQVEGILAARDGILEIRGILVSDNVEVGDTIVTMGENDLLYGLPVGKVLSLSVTDETSIYQYASVAWPVDYEHATNVTVIIGW